MAKIKVLLFERFCRWCCRPLTAGNRHVDHVVPLSRGGLHIPDNLVASCGTCNHRKSNKLVAEWLSFQNFERV
jgi:5-methylcytosine-specific restriction endonuclease McrA